MYEIVLAWLSLAVLCYIYGGYQILLRLLANLLKRDTEERNFFTEKQLPALTVLITVFNEENIIKKRIQNILVCQYPAEKLKIIIASDGSTDRTDQEVSKFDDPRVILFRPEQRRGKTDTQNQALELAGGELIIFTDADTCFDEGFLLAITQPFSDPSIGGVDGHLLFISDNESAISQSQGFYWAQELSIRILESRLGVLAVSSGACLAVRRELFRPMNAAVGEDCLVPLDVVSQGFRMIHCAKAIAYDQMPADSKGEFRTRVRMTMRNWQGTFLYSHLLNPLKQPGLAFALWSHKILRWLSPVFIIIWISTGLISINSPLPWSLTGWLAVVFVIAASLGWLSDKLNINIPIVGAVYSFCLANAGFLIGLIKALRGQVVTVYK